MLVVRSQDRKNLIVGSVTYFIFDNKSKGICETCVSSLSKLEEDIVLAQYSNEEKALKVLNMLEAFVNKDLKTLYNLGSEQVYIEEDNNGFKTYMLESETFYFPKDEDVIL